MLQKYNEKTFANVASENVDTSSEEEKKELEKTNDENKDMFDLMTKTLNIKGVRFTKKLKNHPVCLTSEGNVSVEMEKVINAMPTDEQITAEKVLEINENHPIVKKLQTLYKKDKDELEKYTKILYAQARLIEGLPIDNPTEISNIVCELISK